MQTNENEYVIVRDYHVTRVSGRDVYGHSCACCDPNGCNGLELYLGGALVACRAGDVLVITEDGYTGEIVECEVRS